ncbi:MAG TPA: hypothetical protein VMW62_16660 [Chloroflexota bacterium]|nr:hypothetical protein [Chloroflexota bacterium]
MKGLSALAYHPPAALARRISLRELAWLLPVALFVATLALYVITRSISLDDFDSFNFARAIDHFDLRLNQPQPPGYPVYVLLARVFDLAVHDHQAALTLLSAASGAVAILAFWGVAAQVGAPWAALPLAPMPLFWLSSGMALSDVPGLAMATLATLLVIRGVRDRVAADGFPAALLAGCAATGLAAGVRPQDAILPLGVLAFLASPLAPLSPSAQDREQVRARQLPLAAGVLIAASLAWAIPLAISLGGPAAAWRTLAGQSQYVGATDSLFARPFTLPNLEARMAEFGNVFSAYFGGPADGGLPAFLALMAALILLALLATRARWLALSWLLPYAAFMLLAMRPDDPRKVLPAIPPMLLLLGGIRPKPLAAAACTALAAWFAFSAAPLITIMDTVKAPPEQASAYVASNFRSSDTLVLAGSSYNAIRYHDPAFKAFLLDGLDPSTVQSELASGAYRNLIVLDKEGFTVPDTFVGVDTRTFQRDPLVLPKAATVWMAVFRPLSELRDRDLALPQGPIHIGTPEDVRYLTDGWYRPETVAGVAARWAGQQSQIRFWVERPADATLRLTGVAYPKGQQLTVLVNGQPAAHVPLPTDWAPLAISVPATLFHPRALNVVTLDHSMVASANSATQGQSLDRRPLAAAYSSFELTWR